ncbi:MAG TPA: hypothetical protein VJM83_06140 [Nitrospirota bacterium]|nr:hypothetical protein [Nitrospirota bacterium]
MDALITDACSRMAYSALRSLSALGLDVAVADDKRAGMCQWSRLSKAVHTYAPPLTRPEEFIQDVNRILGETGARFLLPGYEETEVLARHRASLPPDVVLPVADYDKIHMANDKARTMELARSVGVPVAETVEWKELPELERALRQDGGPVVVKLRRGNSAKGVFYPRDPAETLAVCKGLIEKYRLEPGRYPVVQRKVYGPKWSVALVYWEGRELAHFTQLMLRENPPTGGTSTYRVSVNNATLESYARSMVGGLGWHGVVMVEFKYDREREQFTFIELNPRLWGAISNAVSAGADFVRLLYVASTLGPDKAAAMVKPYRTGVYSRWLMGDMMLALSEFKKKRPLSALRLITPGGSDDYDELKADDPGAFFGEFAYFLSKFIRTGALKPVAEEGVLG